MKSIKIKQKLSKNIWTAIRQALADVKRVEKHPDYSINMNRWHGQDEDSNSRVCEVCLGGANIACRSDKKPDQDCSPILAFENGTNERRMSEAMDGIRCGNIEDALMDADLEMSGKIKYFDEVSYEATGKGRARWEKFILSIAQYLEDNKHRIRKVA